MQQKQAICAFLAIVVAVLSISEVKAIEPIWISPSNANYTYESDFFEKFTADKGVWTTIDVGAGARGGSHCVAMDSKGILWILFGTRESRDVGYLTGVWNYNPKTDQYRYVWYSDQADPRDPGELRVPAETNHPGGNFYVTMTIDNNDNLWIYNHDYVGELWMFNTTSMMFTRMFGLAKTETDSPSAGANPGQPGEDVWPGTYEGHCMVTDSQNNIWILTGNNVNGITNSVWYFNTTSLLWTYISGSIKEIRDIHNATFFGGVNYAGCFIDSDDLVWLYGGYGNIDGDYGNLWTYDTRSKREWEIKFGGDTYLGGYSVVSSDFHPDNHPPACEGTIFVDRMDGTCVLVTGATFSDVGMYGGSDTVWLYSKSLNQWKLVYGNTSIVRYDGELVNYRQTGNRMPYVYYPGKHNGKNFNGDVYIAGGYNEDYGPYPNRKEIWLIPQDQCTVGNHKCDTNADCIEELVGYSCECKEGYTGDGFTCTSPPTNPVAPVADVPANSPETSPTASNNPTAAPNQRTSSVSATVVVPSVLLGCAILIL